jgi:hypothetical protein
MDREAFFKTIDEQVEATNKAHSDQAEKRLALNEITRAVIAQVRPVLGQYAEDVRRRGIEARLDDRGSTLTFELHFTKGGYFGFVIGDGKLTETFGEKGWHRRGAEQQLSRTVDLQWFEVFVQKTIAEFMRRAPANGGFLSQTAR